MKLTRVRMLRGPNYWHQKPAIEALVDILSADCTPDDLIRIKMILSSCVSIHNLSNDLPADMFMVKLLELIVLELQIKAGYAVEFSKSHHTGEHGLFKVVVECQNESIGFLAFELAVNCFYAIKNNLAFDFNTHVQQLLDHRSQHDYGVSTQSIINAAIKRKIPYNLLIEDASIIRLGWGSKQRRILAAETDQTSSIAQYIAQNKDLTRQLLLSAGLPVPEGRIVNDLEDGWQEACALGLPVVVKPSDGNQGKCVTVNITEREQFNSAFNCVTKTYDSVIVESHLVGDSFRLLVVGGKMVAASRCQPPMVVGDGKHTIKQLIDVLNQDPRRGNGHSNILTKIALDEVSLECIALQNCMPDSIPSKDQEIYLRHNANLSTGGSATDVTDAVHPDVVACAINAAKIVGLDLCGVDVICKNISEPLKPQGGGIVEVNASPGLRMHIFPSQGQSRPVAEHIVSELFDEGENGRIPVVAVTGTNGKTTTVRLISHIMAEDDVCVGMCATGGVYIDGNCIKEGDCSGPQSAKQVLANPFVDVAVLEAARGGILREGLGFDECNVAVVTNIGEGDHLGVEYIHTVEELACAKSVIVKNLTANGVMVLNAADPLVASMATGDLSQIIFFALDRNNEVLAKHISNHHRVIYSDGVNLVAAHGTFEIKIPWQAIPIAHQGTITFHMENTMAAAAASWALGRDWSKIVEKLKMFTHSGGRFNIFNYKDAKIIADFGHNCDAVAALVGVVEKMPAKRRIAMIAGTGDRRDQDMLQQLKLLGDNFDIVVLYEDHYQRGRTKGSLISLMKQGLSNAKRTVVVNEAIGQLKAIDLALGHLESGDLCVMFIQTLNDVVEHLKLKGATL